MAVNPALVLSSSMSLAKVAGQLAEALARDPEAQRIATAARGKLRLSRLSMRNRRRWYRDVQDACEDLAEATSDAEQHAAALQLLAIGVSEDMIRVAMELAEVMP